VTPGAVVGDEGTAEGHLVGGESEGVGCCC
jgi:hypothetical protein